MSLQCHLADQGISVITDGRIGPCCYFKDYYGEFDSTKNLNYFLNSDRALELRANLKNNIRDSACESCWLSEDAGVKSKRQIINSIENQSQSEKKIYLDLHLSNKCNLKCRTCNPHNSTLWVEEYLSLAEVVFNKYPKKSHVFQNSQKKKFTTEYLVENREIFKKVKRISFLGGEPLLDSAHSFLIDDLIAQNLASEIELEYGTNGLLLQDLHIEKWKNFKNIFLSLSQDGLGEVYEFMRHPAHWQKYLQIFEKLQALSFIHLNVNVTYSLLNVVYLPETLKWLYEKNAHVTLNPVHYPSYFAVFNLPEKIKNMISLEFEEKIKEYPFLKYQLSEVLKYMNSKSPNSVDFENFWKITKHADAWRNQSFEQSLPKTFHFLTKT